MNEHEAALLLDRLGQGFPDRMPPAGDLLVAGRSARRRRTTRVVLASAAAVALVVGGAAMLAVAGLATRPGVPAGVVHRADVAPVGAVPVTSYGQVVGEWRPIRLAGVDLGPRGAPDQGLILEGRQGERGPFALIAAAGGCDPSASWSVTASGGFALGRAARSGDPGFCGGPAYPALAHQPDVVSQVAAAELTAGGQLVLHDARGYELAAYTRSSRPAGGFDRMPVTSSTQVTGRWEPITLLGSTIDRSAWGNDHDLVFDDPRPEVDGGRPSYVAGDGVNDTFGSYALADDGAFTPGPPQGISRVGCSDPCPHVANPEAVARTRSMSIAHDGRLILFGRDGAIIGVYRRPTPAGPTTPVTSADTVVGD